MTTSDAHSNEIHRGKFIHRGLLILLAALQLSILSQFFRSSLGVIAPDLMRDINLSAEQFGILTGSFFIIFALLQVPLGVFLDRFGGRTIISSMMVLTIIGSYLFAKADDFETIVTARLLIGTGCAGNVVGSMVILRCWFSPRNFTMVIGVLFAASNLGNLATTAPLAMMAGAWGWRDTYVGLAVLSAILTLFYALVVRDAPLASQNASEKIRQPIMEIVNGLVVLWKNPNLPYIFVIIGVGYASVITILGVWGGPYLYEIHGLNTIARGNILFVMAVSMVIGTLAFGPLDRWFDTRRGVVTVGAGLTALIFAVLALWPDPSIMVVTVLFALLAFFSSYSLVTMSHGISIFSDEQAGRGVTTLNMSLMGGAALMQWASGFLMELFGDGSDGDPGQTYRALFWALAMVTVLAVLIYRFADDVKPSSIKGK